MSDRKMGSSAEFEQLLRSRHPTLEPLAVTRFIHFYQMVLKWNPRLHLTTLTTPALFLARHVEEVLFAHRFLLPGITAIWDLGSGLGVPGVPFAILNPALPVTLVESSRNKAIYLEALVADLELAHVEVLCRRVEELAPLPPGAVVTSRAIERMGALLTSLVHLSANSAQLLLFCSHDLAQSLPGARLHLLPGSTDRYLASLIPA
jgi:16S rRNA (guanine527-N7)-methyltransferase